MVLILITQHLTRAVWSREIINGFSCSPKIQILMEYMSKWILSLTWHSCWIDNWTLAQIFGSSGDNRSGRNWSDPRTAAVINFYTSAVPPASDQGQTRVNDASKPKRSKQCRVTATLAWKQTTSLTTSLSDFRCLPDWSCVESWILDLRWFLQLGVVRSCCSFWGLKELFTAMCFLL